MVDVVSQPRADLHADLLRALGAGPEQGLPFAVALSAVAYCLGEEGEPLEVRCVGLGVGQPLGKVPLALREGPVVMVDLEEAYGNARRRCRLQAPRR